MADDVLSYPRRNSPACAFKGCGAQAGDRWCYTATGFRRHWHAVRRATAAGQPAPAGKPAGSLAGRRPSDKQADMLAWAIHGDGTYEVSGYGLRGEAQKRNAMNSMADESRGWFRRLRETDDGTLYEITDAGRQASARYETWMNGGNR